jgi:hypothetical protein
VVLKASWSKEATVSESNIIKATMGIKENILFTNSAEIALMLWESVLKMGINIWE